MRRYLDYYKMSADQLIVVTDDIALPFGTMRIRNEGSAGGHNGLKSIEAYLNTAHYVRVRMGIGKLESPATVSALSSAAGSSPDAAKESSKGSSEQPLADYVLSPFSSEEKAQLTEFVIRGVQVTERLLHEHVTVVMNSVNVKPRKPAKEDKEKANTLKQGTGEQA